MTNWGAAQMAKSINSAGAGNAIGLGIISESLDNQAVKINEVADSIGMVANSLDNNAKITEKIADSLTEVVGIQFNELELEKVELIKNLEQEILDFIIKCQEKGITLDISKIKLNFQQYSYACLKNSVEKYIELISFKSIHKETEYKESQEYVQGEIEKLLRDMPPFMKKYTDYNYGHFFIDRIAYGLYERNYWGKRVCSNGIASFSSRSYQFQDYKGVFHNLMDDVVYDMDGNQLWDHERRYLIDYEPNIKSELYTFDSEFARKNPKNYLGYKEELSIFENGKLRRKHRVWFNRKNEFQKYGYIVVPDYYHLPIIRYYYEHCEGKLREEFLSILKEKRLECFGKYYYPEFAKFLKDKGIIDIEQKLKSGELDYDYLFQVIDPIGDIIKRIKSNLANEDIFKEKYSIYLQDTINEYSNILKELKLQVIVIGQSNTLNSSPAKETQGPTRRRVYRKTNVTANSNEGI